MASALCRIASRSLPRLVRKTAPVTTVRQYSDEVEKVTDNHEGKVVEKGRIYSNELGHSVAKARYELLGIRKDIDVWDDLPHTLEEGEGTFSNPKVIKGIWEYRLLACVLSGRKVSSEVASSRFEILEKFAGKEDPFEVAIRKIRMFGSVNVVPSTKDERLIGCICEEECPEVAWWPLKKGGVTKCGCGHKFLLVGPEDEMIKREVPNKYF